MKNNLKTAVILAAIGGLLIVIGGAIWGGQGAFIGFAIGMVFVGGSYWFSDKLAIRAAKAVPVTEEQMPRYYAIVRDLCQRADIPMPKLFVSPDPQPNAFATGRSPQHAAVCVNQGILEILDLGRAAGRPRPRDQPRPQPRHPDLVGRGGDRHGHHLRGPHGHVGRHVRRWRRRP